MSYRYETHCHTALSSACGRFRPEELVSFYCSLGIDGVIVTDHFFTGNCVVRAYEPMPWDQKVHRLLAGYHAVKEASQGTDLSVFGGWEYNWHGAEFLTYGLDENWLLAHPETLTVECWGYLDMVHAAGGFVSQAHPFRCAPYLHTQTLVPGKTDAIEVLNASHADDTYYNAMANDYAERAGLLKTAGSDAHAPTHHLAGLEFDHRLESIEDFISSVKSGEGKIFEIRL